MRPADAESMVGLRRLANIRDCIGPSLTDGVPGDLIETGVWRGGSASSCAASWRPTSDTDRTVWVADSFEGLPEADDGRYQADIGDEFHTSASWRSGRGGAGIFAATACSTTRCGS